MRMAKKKEKIPPPPGVGASLEELAAYFEKYGLEELELAGYVRNLTEDEEKDFERLAEHCRARVEERKSTRTQLNLAMTVEQFERFTKYADRKHIPPSTLARAWLLERLDQEAKDI